MSPLLLNIFLCPSRFYYFLSLTIINLSMLLLLSLIYLCISYFLNSGLFIPYMFYPYYAFFTLCLSLLFLSSVFLLFHPVLPLLNFSPSFLPVLSFFSMCLFLSSISSTYFSTLPNSFFFIPSMSLFHPCSALFCSPLSSLFPPSFSLNSSQHGRRRCRYEDTGFFSQHLRLLPPPQLLIS